MNKSALRQTGRTYADSETGRVFELWEHPETHDFSLWRGDECVNGFYAAAHAGAEIKLNTGRVVRLSLGEFYNLNEGESVKSRKFDGMKRFNKI
jgi:hypothetical protein